MVQAASLVEYGSRRVIITITAIVCALLEIVDTTIVNVSLNDMKGNLGATTSEIGWVVTAYAIGNVIIIPMTSWLSLQFGRRNYFAASIILFTICSFLCGNANGIWELVIFRFIQGAGGGALLSAGLVVLMATPMARVAVSVVEFARSREWWFVLCTMFVLSLLLGSLIVALRG